MGQYRWRDYDDGFDEASLFDDEEVGFERIVRQRIKKPLDNHSKRSRGDERPRDGEKSDRRRELASVKAWGTPY